MLTSWAGCDSVSGNVCTVTVGPVLLTSHHKAPARSVRSAQANRRSVAAPVIATVTFTKLHAPAPSAPPAHRHGHDCRASLDPNCDGLGGGAHDGTDLARNRES